MSEKEIIAYFRNRQEKTCGRFQSMQLKTYAIVSSRGKLNFNFLSKSIFGFSLFSLLTVNQSQAYQNMPLALHATQQKIQNQQQDNDVVIKGEHFVEGVVVDENNEPLPGMSVYIKGTDIGTVTNAEGKFKILEPVKAGDIILFSGIGFENKEFVVKKNAPKYIDIRMEFKDCDYVFLGEVTTQEIYTSKRTFWQKIEGIFR